MSNDLKYTFLHNYHKDNGAKFLTFSNYSMPINYNLGIIKEHLHVRSNAGIFDVSHMGQILITLSDINIEALEKFIPLNFNNLKFNKSYYTFMLNNMGGIIDDLIISKILYEESQYFFIVYNAGRKIQDEEIFKDILSDYKFLKNNSLIAIQGPKAKQVLNFLKITDSLFFMESKVVDYLNENIIVNRSGYTGEDGFEISIPNSIVLNFVKLIMNNEYSKLCGLGSRDSLRLEAGLNLYGQELSEDITPIDANLNWSINIDRLKDKKLNGQNFLLEQFNKGTKIKKIGLQAISKIILRAKMKLIDKNNNEIGIITSGGYSPTLNSSIGIGYVNSLIKNNDKIFSLIRGNLEELKITNLPFIKHNYKKGK